MDVDCADGQSHFFRFDDFEVDSIDDNKLSVSKFDEDSLKPAVLSEHLWTISLKDRRDRAASEARKFRFASALIEPKESLYQRYDDADLKSVEQEVTLQQTWDKPDSGNYILYGGILLALLCIAATVTYLYLRSTPESKTQAHAVWHVPDDITPFSVLTLLKSIQSENGMSSQFRADLTQSISQIEGYYFASKADVPKPDLAAEARSWVGKAV